MCSCVMDIVGKLLILSLSAGGGPVFSNWFNNFRKGHTTEFQLGRITAVFIIYYLNIFLNASFLV